VIDDDPSVCRALRRLLLSGGMEVETHLSGQSFLDAVLRREPDCLVLDIRMPGMSGPALHDRLMAAGRRIPVVFITAHAKEENGLSGGETEILRKPFGEQTLLDAIHRAITRGSGC
jgi:FixJ family two-component response regulator